MAYKYTFGDTGVSLLDQALSRQQQERAQQRQLSQQQAQFEQSLASQEVQEAVRQGMAAQELRVREQSARAEAGFRGEQVKLARSAEGRAKAEEGRKQAEFGRLHDRTIPTKELDSTLLRFAKGMGKGGKLSLAEYTSVLDKAYQYIEAETRSKATTLGMA